MVQIASILLLFFVVALFGTTFYDFLNSIAYTAACSGCPKGWEALRASFKNILSAGQGNVEDGMKGLVALKDSGSPIAGQMAGYYKQKVYIGSAITLLYLILLTWVMNKILSGVTGFPAPFFSAIFISFVIVGIVSLIFGAGFYNGWIMVMQNWSTFTTDFANMISVGPYEIPTNNTTILNNSTGG